MISSVETSYAAVAELADALDSGSSGVTAVEVRVLSAASLLKKWHLSDLNKISIAHWLSVFNKQLLMCFFVMVIIIKNSAGQFMSE